MWDDCPQQHQLYIPISFYIQLIFSGYSSDLGLVYMLEPRTDSIGSSFSGTPQASKFSASVHISDTEPVTQLLHNLGQCYIPQVFPAALAAAPKQERPVWDVWDVLQNNLEKGRSLFAGGAVPSVIRDSKLSWDLSIQYPQHQESHEVPSSDTSVTLVVLGKH